MSTQPTNNNSLRRWLTNDSAAIQKARRLLGEDKIIGITANTVDEALTACEQGADYLGVGTIFSTQTYVDSQNPSEFNFYLLFSRKKDTKSVIGPEGLKNTLAVLDSKGHNAVPVVCIGGLNASNVFQVMFRGSPKEKPVDGVAVVSAIMAAEDPEAASRHLLDLVVKSDKMNRSAHPRSGQSRIKSKEDVLELVPQVIKTVHETKPLSHNMTNLVI